MSDHEHGLLFSAAASPSATTASVYRIMRLDLGTNTQYLGPDRWQLQWWRPERLRVRPTELSGCGLQHAGQYKLCCTSRRNHDHV
jgi:hypothetical protein